MARSADNRIAIVNTSLGGDVLLLRSFSGTEQLGRPFHYELDLLSENDAIDFDHVVGTDIAVGLVLQKGGARYFSGCVSRFVHTGRSGRLAHYHATVVPWLWFLTRTADCRIFLNEKEPKPAGAIVKEVIQEHGFSQLLDSKGLSGTYHKWEYCVQYRETDFNFISRLLENEGIYYYFAHGNGEHKMMLADSMSAHKAFPGYEEIQYRPPDEAFREKETIYDWRIERELQPGACTLNDFDFEKPRTPLITDSKVKRMHPRFGHEIYDYPGAYVTEGDGKTYAKVRIEELQSDFEVVSGESNARGIAPGYKFKLIDCPRGDQNREYLVTSANYHIESDEYDASGNSGGPTYTCTFTAVPKDQPFRPARVTPKPMIQGPQTAIVVGKKGEEIWTDKYGRVKLQFHWDRYGKSDENSSCWVRVSQEWAGKNWGSMHVPRIGQEVIVDFLEGDPDRPIITGRVYNAEQMPPYGLPAEMTKSTLKSNSSKGGVGFNEIRFEDKKDKEQIFIHAERNMDVRVKGSRMESVGGDQHVTVGGEKDGKKSGNQHVTVFQDDHLHVHRDLREQIDGNKSLLVGFGDAADGGNANILIEKNRNQDVGKEDHLHVGGDRKQKIDGATSLEVGKDQQEKVGMKHALEAGQEIHLKAGMKLILEAGMQLTLKGPGGFIDIGPVGVTIQGTLVKINSGGAAGSGSGSSPQAPDNASASAPIDATAADNAKTGQKSAPG